jgi:DNA-binding transcriptional LysR family regulator
MRSSLINDYEAFVAVASAGSFIGGAKALGITPSAMSQIIRRLEERVGIQLFHRTTRSISTTEQGERLLARLRLAFQEIDIATEELSERRARPAGCVRIVIPRVAYDDLLAPILARLNTAYPEIALEIRIDDAITDIVSSGYDIGFRLGEYINPETVAFPVGMALRQLAVASPAYIAAHGAPAHPRDLARHRCINWRQHPDAPPYSWEFSKNSEQISVAVQGPITVNDRAAAMRAAVDGIGISMWVEHRVRPLIECGALIPLLEDWSPWYNGFFAYYHRDRHTSPATRAIVAFLREHSQTPAA